MKKLFLLTTMLLTLATSANAQRTTDKLDRGLVAVPSGSSTFVSWRIFGEEYYDTEYNLYRNGVKLNATPLKVSNYTDTQGTAGATYQVAAVVRGVEQEKCNEVTRLGQQYIQFAVGKLYSRRGTDITASYDINDIALADLDGDGVSEFILKRNYTPDKMSVNNDSAYNVLDCYTLQGKQTGTSLAIRSVARFFGLSNLYDFFPTTDIVEYQAVRIDAHDKSQGQIAATIQYNYPILTDDFMFRMAPDRFSELRANYSYRREFYF